MSSIRGIGLLAKRRAGSSSGWLRRARPALALAVGTLLLLAGQAPVGAQATRTWVSGVGDDANPCSRTAPCKTFAGAISKTAAFGEINAIDPGGFGAVTITKSITISGEGVEAGILASLTNGVIVNAAATDVVVLRNLDIDGAGNGLNGIRWLNGASLIIEDTVVNGFNTHGIDVNLPASGTARELLIKNATISNMDGATSAGVRVTAAGGAAGAVKAVLDNVRLTNNARGLEALDNVRVLMRDSLAHGHAGAGIKAASTVGSEVDLVRVTSTGNLNGISVDGNNQTIVRMLGVVVTGNTNGIAVLTTLGTGAQVLSPGAAPNNVPGINLITGNGVNGAPTGGLATQ